MKTVQRPLLQGVHTSYVNICGAQAALRHLRLIRAFPWANMTLLYRKEIGLDILDSAMAVLVQEMIDGKVSGVAFGKNPDKEAEAVVEAVYGLNRGIVDSTVEPDSWTLPTAEKTSRTGSTGIKYNCDKTLSSSPCS